MSDSLTETLTTDALACVAAALAPGCVVTASLTCRALREACRVSGRAMRTPIEDMYATPALCAWARATLVGLPWDCKYAAAHLATLQWAREHGCPWDENTCQFAASGGHLDVLKWAPEHGCPFRKWWMCDSAAKEGHLAVLQWARENGCWWTKSTCAAAAGGGHLAVLQWAREHGCPEE